MIAQSNDLPQKLRADVVGSFARKTLDERFPRIVSEISEHCAAPTASRLAGLLGDILDNNFVDSSLLDGSNWWRHRSQEARGTKWADWSFFDLEFMFYRSIVTVFSKKADPFFASKYRALNSVDADFVVNSRSSSFEAKIVNALFANDHDLSQISHTRHAGHTKESKRILINEYAQWNSRISSSSGQILGYILDNVGRELYSDLDLIVFLISTAIVSKVQVYLKPFPMFVSDATGSDLIDSLKYLSSHDCVEARRLSKNVSYYLDSGQIEVFTDEDWGDARSFDNLSPSLDQQLRSCVGLIFKGDLNYRRFIQDRAWPYGTEARVASKEVPFRGLVLRTLKSEVLVGVSSDQVLNAQKLRTDWLTDGYFGVAQQLGLDHWS